jgi:subtilisin family serine protease
LIEAAQARGSSVVAAWDRSASDGGFPAALDGVIAVADENGAPLRGSRAWLAPGTDVPTTVPPSRWASVSGSSYAAAHVSALLALMLEARERRGGAAGSPAVDLVAGGGHAVDACASLRKAALACICACGRPGLGDSVARH